MSAFVTTKEWSLKVNAGAPAAQFAALNAKVKAEVAAALAALVAGKAAA